MTDLITDQELMEKFGKTEKELKEMVVLYSKIEQVCTDFTGQIDHLYEVVGMVVAGRLFGWRVMRLVSSRRCWTLAFKLFGDPKLLMPERGSLTRKSIGLDIVDGIGRYWDVISGKSNRDDLPLHERKFLKQ